ncbi:MAG: type II secretion system protein [Patescibacteria group bacterium]
MHSTKKGFTLIELLIVITIIGILSSIVLVSLSESKKKSQVAKIVQEVKRFQTAMEQYRLQNNGYYPGLVQAWTLTLVGDNMTPFITALNPYLPVGQLGFTTGVGQANFHMNYIGSGSDLGGTCGGVGPSASGYNVMFQSSLNLPELKTWSNGSNYYCFTNI